MRKLSSFRLQQRCWYGVCRRLQSNSSAPLDCEWRQPTGPHTGIEIYNTILRQKVPLILNSFGYATWYTCGPTVYDSMHIGHASCYVKLDIIQRILREHFKYNLVTAMNITDIDDKIIRKSQECGRGWREVARGYEEEFWKDMQKLNCCAPNLKLRVTDKIPNIVSFIQRLIDSEKAYIADDKSVYFDVSKCTKYGKLQKLNLSFAEREELLSSKTSAADFALWKAQKTPDEPSWKAPWGAGRPGWHIECSTLASILFGNVIDFHAGGLDLRFPHHENEEAQSCAYHGTEQWVNNWLHTGQLNLKDDTEKMSKSLGNTISVSKLLAVYSADDFRMACLLSNYRNSMAFSPELMQTAQQTLNKFKCFNADCYAYLTGKKRPLLMDANALNQQLKYTTEQVDTCLRDDFNTANAMTALIDQITSISRCVNTNEMNAGAYGASCLDTVAAIQNFVVNKMNTFGLETFSNRVVVEQSAEQASMVNLRALVEDLLNSRTLIRERAVTGKNNELFKICDDLRDVLSQHGIQIRDHNNGSTWTVLASKHKKI